MDAEILNKNIEKSVSHEEIFREKNFSSGWSLQKASEEYGIPFGEKINVTLPHHWQCENGFEKYSGKAIYTKQFVINKKENVRYFIKFYGVFYSATFFLNKKQIAKKEGYFSPSLIEIPQEYLDKKIEITILVESYEESNLRRKKYVTGIYGHWDAHEPDFNPGGICNKVTIVEKGNISVKNALLTVNEITKQNNVNNALTTLKLVTDCPNTRHALLKVKLIPLNFEGKEILLEKDLTFHRGEHRVKNIQLYIDSVELWYPYEIGAPNVYKVSIEIKQGGKVSDKIEFTYGFRILRIKNWHIDINGTRIYSKGINVGPLRFRFAGVNGKEWDNEFRTLRELGCNMIRVHCHVQIKEFYEYADLYGIMIYQDFPLQWMYGKGVEKSALKQIKEMVTLFYNHPSIVIWSAHNEPFYIGSPEEMDKTNFWNVWEVVMFNYDKVVLDRKLRAAAKSIDKTRYINRASSIYSIVGFKGTDIHAYWGWYFGEITLFNKLRRYGKRNFAFVSEFGAQSIPNYFNAIRIMPSDLEKVDWEYLRLHHNCQTRLIQMYTPVHENDNLEKYIEKTQEYQKRFIQYYMDVIRLVKNRPNAGMLAFMYRSCHPGIDWSIIDYWGGRKKAFTTIRRAFQKIYPFAFFNKNNVLHNKKNIVTFYIENDIPEIIQDVELHIRIKVNKQERFCRKFDVTLPPSSGAVKVLSLKLDDFFKLGELRVLLLAISGKKRYKNIYVMNHGE